MVRKNTKIIAIISGLSLLVGIILYVIALGIVGSQKEQHITHITEQAESLAHKESLQKLMSMLDETKSERESLTTRFVQDEEVIDFLSLIETVGTEQGINLETSSLSVLDVNEHFEYLVMQVKVKGWYSQLLHTLSIVEHLPYQISLNGVNLRKNPDGSWEGDFGLQVTKFKKYEK